MFSYQTNMKLINQFENFTPLPFQTKKDDKDAKDHMYNCTLLVS